MLNPGRPSLSASLVLFLCLFAGQAAVLVLSPILPLVAHEFGVSTPTAGQLRALSGLVAGVTALTAERLARRMGLRDMLVAGLVLVAAGSFMSALAPSFAILALAQVAVGVGLAALLSGGVAAAGEWAAPGRRSRVLSWALVGPPAAWVVGMPLVGAVSRAGWRSAWLAFPFAAAIVALVAVASRPADPAVGASANWLGLLRDRDVAGWAIGELLAYSAWSGTLVFAGALFVESYGATIGAVGLLLGGVAIAYIPGNFLARRSVDHLSRGSLIGLAVAASIGVAMFGMFRPGVWTSEAILAALAFVNGARTIAGSAFGLDAAPERKLAVMSLRAAGLQFGYLIGALLGGAALAAGGYSGLGVVLSGLFLLAAVPHVVLGLRGRTEGRLAHRLGPAPEMAMRGTDDVEVPPVCH